MAMNAGRSLSVIRAEELARIDTEAEKTRLRFITGGAGQSMVYQQKANEARAYLADNNVVGPHLTAEVGITGANVAEVAQIILNMEALWLELSVAIEAARLTAKASIETATTVSAMRAVTVDWNSVVNAVLN